MQLTTLIVLGLSYAGTSVAVPPAPVYEVGCYSENHSLKTIVDDLQTQAVCQNSCEQMGYKVWAINDGTACLCGDKAPSPSSQVKGGKCDTPCPGFANQSCGGKKFFTVGVPVKEE